jgi:NAD(P)-dependent dehydrogenase (short-subunit alcohol dehydrogenase family)
VTEIGFEGKVALITGGSSGIGRATALAFARRGAAVIIASRHADRGKAVESELKHFGARAEFVTADVSKPDDVAHLVSRTVERFGKIDFAVNNAGSLDIGVFKAIAEFSEQEFDGHLALNLKSVWLCMKHEITHMLRLGTGGSIVNTSSVNGLGGVAQNALYATAKAGILALTKSAAQEYGSHRIRINALVAGAFRTPMLETAFERVSSGKGSTLEEAYAKLTPLGRIGMPEEAAEAVVWLCSDAASYVTGHSLIVDGGMTSAFR